MCIGNLRDQRLMSVRAGKFQGKRPTDKKCNHEACVVDLEVEKSACMERESSMDKSAHWEFRGKDQWMKCVHWKFRARKENSSVCVH